MVSLQNIRPGNIVVWCDDRRGFLHVRSQGLVVFDLCQGLIFGQLGLDILFPVCLAEFLCLCDPWAAVLCRIGPTGGKNFLVNCLVVRPSQLNVWSSVGIVVRLEMRRYGMLELEVRLANARRVFCALVECRRASKEDGDDGVPGEEPAD